MSPNDLTKQPLWIESGDPETENMPKANDLQPGALGAQITIKQPHRGEPSAGGEDYTPKTYQKVEVDSSISGSPYRGATAYWSDPSNYKVTIDPTGRMGRPAGIFQYAVTLGNIGFVQKRGLATVKFIEAGLIAEPSAAGAFVIPSATAGKADCLAVGTAATYPPFGVAAGTRNPASEALVHLNVDDTTP